MKIRIIKIILAIFVLFIGVLSPVFADLQADPANKAPSNQRDKYQTDLYTGSASYSYPIQVPQGTNGLTPNVSLDYNSSGVRDNTTVTGIGWQLNRDYVERDVNYTPGNTADDKYKLHFQGATYDLVYNPSDSLFHTSIESHLKIQQFLSGGQSSTGVYWQVTTTDGTIYRFGYLATSDLVCSDRSYDKVWDIDQVQDTHSNKIYYTYTQSSNVSYLSQIKYNNDQQREVDFTYASNPYQHPIYQQGCTVTETSQLSNIQVKSSGSLVHQYDLSYGTAGNSQPILQSITEKGSNGTALPATTFNYQAEISNWNLQYTIGASPIDAFLPSNEVTLADMNGDGKTDIVRSVNNGGPNNEWRVFTANGTGGWNTQYTLYATAIDANLTSGEVRVLDVNGDGYADVVRSVNNGGPNNEWRVYLNNGSSLSSQYQVWASPIDAAVNSSETTLADVNGDGLPDIVRSVNNGGPNNEWRVFLNTGSGWSTQYQVWASPIDANLTSGEVRVEDVNGDGLADIVRSVNDGGPNNEWRVFLNTGSGWSTQYQVWANPIDANFTSGEVTLADVNGDGLTDIVRAVNIGGPNTEWRVFKNNGHGWDQYTVWASSIDAFIPSKEITLADVNGDGLTDIIRSVNNGGPNDEWRVFKNNGVATNLLTSIHNSQGGSISFDYQPSTKYDNTGPDTISDLPFATWVVNTMTVNNGLSNSQGTNDTTTYSYKDGLYNWQNKEFRGFGEVDETDPNGAKKQTLFNQDDALKGKLISSLTTDASGSAYAKTEDTWSNSLSNSIYTVNLTSEKNYTYDGSATNPKQTEIDYLYDTYGNVTKKSELGDTSTSGDERFTYYEYAVNPSAWIVNTLSHTYQNASNDATKVSESWNYYDSHTGLTDAPSVGDVTKQVKWLDGGTNPTTTYQYDSYGNQTQETDANNHTTTTAFGTTDTTHTYPDSTTNAKNQTTTTVYDLGTGNLLSKTDPNGFATTYTYDVFGRILKEIKPYDSSSYPTTSYQYFDNTTAPQGTLVSKRTISNDPSTLNVYTYIDGLGRTIQTRSDAEDTTKQIVTDTFYDPNGQASKQTVPHLDTLSTTFSNPVTGTKNTTTTYDPISRVLTITNPNNTTKTSAYNHWVQTNTDENGHQKKQYFNAFGKVSQVDEINAVQTYTTTYNYDTFDNITNITNANNNNITFTYDTLGRKITQVDPDMGTWHYGYDGIGNITSQTDNRNITTAKTYDELNRVTKVDYPTDTDVTYTYDGNSKVGTLTSVTDGAGTVSYQYDNRLRKTQEQRVTDGITWTTSYAYDAADRLTSTTKPSGETVTNGYNAQGEIASVSGVLTNVDYNAQNKITQKTFANSLVTNYTYNTDDFRLNRIQTGTFQDMSYTYDNVGNVQSITDNLLTKAQNFGYDDLDRLTVASESGSYNYAYQYNSIGNLTKFTNAGNDTDYTYGQNAGVHALTASSENPSVTPTPTNGATPTPTPTIPMNTMVYDDSLASGWSDASFNTNNSTTTTFPDVYTGSVALVSSLGSQGGVDFQAPAGSSTNAYDTLHFALRSDWEGQQYEVYIDSTYGQPLATPVSLANYGGQPTPYSWKVYNIPLADLGATNVSLRDIVIHNPDSSDEPGSLFIDQVKLSAGSPVSLVSSVADDWSSGSINTSLWDDWSSSHASVENNQLKITSGLSSDYYGLGINEVKDLTNSYVTNQLVNAGNQDLYSWEVFPIIILKPGGNYDNQILFFVSHNTVIARKEVDGVYTDINTDTYYSAIHKFFRVRESGGTIYYDTSADGKSWTNFAATASPFDITNVIEGMTAGTWQTEATTTSATFDNFNILPPISPASSFSDDWSSGSIDSQWANWGDPQTSVVNNQLKITSTLNDSYNGVDSGADGNVFDMTGSSIVNQLVNAGNQNLASWQAYPLYIIKRDDPGNYQLLFFVSNNTVFASKIVEGVYTDIHTAAYNSSTQKFFRIRESGGTTYFDTSADDQTWTNFTSLANPFNLTHVVVGQQIGTWQTEATTTSATFDNFNIVPPILPTASFGDDWSTGSIGSKWENWGAPQTSIVSNQLKIVSTLNTDYHGLDSSANDIRLDLTGSYVSNKLVNAGNQSLAHWEVYPVYILNGDNPDNDKLFFIVSNNTVHASKVVAGTYTDMRTATYNSSTYKYFKIRENAGTIYFDTSSNGTSWTNFYSLTNPFNVSKVIVGQLVGTWQAEASTTFATFDNFSK